MPKLMSPTLLPRSIRRSARRLGRWLGTSPFQLVYHKKYQSALPEIPVDPLRAEHILAFLASEGLVLRRSVHRPEPVWWKTLELIHTTKYLDALQEVKAFTSIMGTEISQEQIDRLIDVQRLHVGGTLMATRRARSRGIGVNLGGGFHHAADDGGGGFCIFNDIATAIADERRRGFRGRVLVVDLDLHDGDGTRRIFAHNRDVFTFSIHARHWGSVDAESSFSLELGSEVDDATYLGAIEEHLPAIFQRFRPHLVFYLAGSDPARDDSLGNWNITADAMLKRDQRVFSLARQGQRAPLVVVLAGGYGHNAWRYNARFLANLSPRDKTIEPPETSLITLERYRYIANLLGPEVLSGVDDSTDNFGIEVSDLLPPSWGMTKETRLLGYYTKNGIERVLEQSGFLERLRDLGYPHPFLELQLDDPAGDTLRVYGDPDQEQLLVELRVRKDRRIVPGFQLLSAEWLLLQNPRAGFGPKQQPLPGQKHPGLGMLNDVVALLRLAAERLHLDGLVFVPSQYHIAAYGNRHLRFLDPEAARLFRALLGLLRDLPLAEATRHVAEGRVIDEETGEPVKWLPRPMLLPVTRHLEQHMKECCEGEEGVLRLRLELPGVVV